MKVKDEIRGLSIGQPWAELIVRRRKLIEIRSRKFAYRGPLLIHASQRMDKYAAQKLGIAVDGITRGAFVGIATLDEIRPFTKKDAAMLKARSGGLGGWEPSQHAWVLKSVHRLKPPIPFKGQVGLMRVPKTIARKIASQFSR